MLTAHNLTFAHTNRKFTFPDLTCDPGTPLLILGESGTGKTTLLHLLAGLLQPTGGEVSIQNTNIGQLSGSALDHFRGRHIGLVFQQAHFVAALSVKENLVLAQKLAGVPRDTQRMLALCERLGLSSHLNKKPNQLSQGEQQRVAIARALLNQPNVILADEPTASLDDSNAQTVASLLEEEAAAAGAALIIVTHDNRLKQRFTNCVTI